MEFGFGVRPVRSITASSRYPVRAFDDIDPRPAPPTLPPPRSPATTSPGAAFCGRAAEPTGTAGSGPCATLVVVTNDDAPGDWLLEGGGDAADVAARYDDWAATYDDDLDSWSYRAPQIVAAQVVAHAPGASSVLDVGCGTGLVGRALRAVGYEGEIHGIDLSAASLRVAARTGAYTTLRSADLQQPLDAADVSVDAVTCVGVMTYVPDVEAAWREFVRVVRRGGLVVVTQREDLWDARGCPGVIDRLSDEGRWTPLDVAGPAPYLPGNPDGMGPVGVYYVTARVT